MKPYTWYSFKILAFNSKGNGEASTPVEIRTEEQGKWDIIMENGFYLLKEKSSREYLKGAWL